MLFNDYTVEQKILDKAHTIAAEKNFTLVYGAVMGSISRGIHSYDSDYDLRFLYIDNQFPQKLRIPSKCQESDIIYRYFTPKFKDRYISIQEPYDRIAFWELSAFLYLIIQPEIGSGTINNDHLYYIVEHTFLTPYSWDPYGIQSSVIPYISTIPNRIRAINYYKNMISKYFIETEEISAKDYTDAIWACLSANWVLSYRTIAPVNINVLLSILNESKLEKAIREHISSAYDLCKSYYLKYAEDIRSSARDHVFVKRNPIIDSFIYKTIENLSQISDEQNILNNTDRNTKIWENLCSGIHQLMNPFSLHNGTQK